MSDKIQALARSARTLLKLDRTGQRRQLMDPHGTGDGTFGNLPTFGAIEQFRADVDFVSAQDCISRYGMVPGDAYEAFCKAVDG